jgi:hypothetical protein
VERFTSLVSTHFERNIRRYLIEQRIFSLLGSLAEVEKRAFLGSIPPDPLGSLCSGLRMSFPFVSQTDGINRGVSPQTPGSLRSGLRMSFPSSAKTGHINTEEKRKFPRFARCARRDGEASFPGGFPPPIPRSPKQNL